MNQTTGKAIIQLVLHYILLFEHLKLLELRATSAAGKTMLFCVVYSRRKCRAFSVLSTYLALILAVNHRKRLTLNGSLQLQFYCVLSFSNKTYLL